MKKKSLFAYSERYAGLSVDELFDKQKLQRTEIKKERSTPSKKKDYLRENQEYPWNVLTVTAWNTHDTEKQDRVSSVTDERSAEGYTSFRMARICTPRS